MYFLCWHQLSAFWEILRHQTRQPALFCLRWSILFSLSSSFTFFISAASQETIMMLAHFYNMYDVCACAYRQLYVIFLKKNPVVLSFKDEDKATLCGERRGVFSYEFASSCVLQWDRVQQPYTYIYRFRHHSIFACHLLQRLRETIPQANELKKRNVAKFERQAKMSIFAFSHTRIGAMINQTTMIKRMLKKFAERSEDCINIKYSFSKWIES